MCSELWDLEEPVHLSKRITQHQDEVRVDRECLAQSSSELGTQNYIVRGVWRNASVSKSAS